MSNKKDGTVNASRRSLLKSSAASAGVIAASSIAVSAGSSEDVESAPNLADYIRDHASGVLSHLQREDTLEEFDVDVHSLTNEEWVAANRKSLDAFEGRQGVVVTKRFSGGGFVTPIQVTLTNEDRRGELVVVPEKDNTYFIEQPLKAQATIQVQDGVKKHQTEYRFISDEEQVSTMVESQREKDVQTERIGTQEARIQGCVIDICAAGITGPDSGTCVTKRVYCPACTVTIRSGCGKDCSFNSACTPWWDPCERFGC
ncbi:hypothetical protein G9C85_04035 [Halorubellus sp. JP-L1]|uniref:hypothetical protein n=1 Tax=Halorubellus sp. JP-L1 TaxID=2715753 RepID=UPI00140E8590|nr:hypothetical protein [Halorubellus sp. JP-L1]NHN40804.1 hypothetical protein [Halorubellus sp. JP-L1]